MQGRPVGEFLDVAVEGPGLEQLEVEVRRASEDRVRSGLTGEYREDRHLDPVDQTGGQQSAVERDAAVRAQRYAGLFLEPGNDVDGVARFCLGRFWRTATPDQQTRFLAAFHEVLVTNISAKLGEYKGVKLAVQRGRQQDDTGVVTTLVERPNNPPALVDWVVEKPTVAPKIIDVIAEGTSLRLTQRQDYAAYLTRNNNDIDALINAMKQQTTNNR